MLKSTAYNDAYYREHATAGLDYLGHGEWHVEYGRWLRDAMRWDGKKVLDVGCACGSIMRGLGSAGIVVQGVDLSEHMINLGREKWPDMANLLHVCDAVNLHLYGDSVWDGIHCNQVSEHWRPHLVAPILKELHRVTKIGGVMLSILDTAESMAREGRDPNAEGEDPTHFCIKPMNWWGMQLGLAGWTVINDFDVALRDHPATYLRHYQWDYFVARKDRVH